MTAPSLLSSPGHAPAYLASAPSAEGNYPVPSAQGGHTSTVRRESATEESSELNSSRDKKKKKRRVYTRSVCGGEEEPTV